MNYYDVLSVWSRCFRDAYFPVALFAFVRHTLVPHFAFFLFISWWWKYWRFFVVASDSVLELFGGGSRSTTPVSLNSRKSPTADMGVQVNQKDGNRRNSRGNIQPDQQQERRNSGRLEGQGSQDNRVSIQRPLFLSLSSLSLSLSDSNWNLIFRIVQNQRYQYNGNNQNRGNWVRNNNQNVRNNNQRPRGRGPAQQVRNRFSNEKKNNFCFTHFAFSLLLI